MWKEKRKQFYSQIFEVWLICTRDIAPKDFGWAVSMLYKDNADAIKKQHATMQDLVLIPSPSMNFSRNQHICYSGEATCTVRQDVVANTSVGSLPEQVMSWRDAKIEEMLAELAAAK